MLWYPHVPIAFFLTLNSAPASNVYVLYKYSCLDIGPICFIGLTRSIAYIYRQVAPYAS